MKSCKVIRGGESFLGKQGLNYFAGISAESANAEAICMHMLVMPPGASAKPHYHDSHGVPMAPLTQNVVIAGFIPATHFSACSDTRRVVPWVTGINPVMTSFFDYEPHPLAFAAAHLYSPAR